MPLSMEVVINLRFEGLRQEIMFIYNRQHWLLWMWLQDVLFYMYRRFYLQECCYNLLEGWDGQIGKENVHNYAPCHLPNVNGQNDPSLATIPSGLRMYVVWVIFKNCHYVVLWSMFLRLSHGMFHAISGKSANWQMFLPLGHWVYLGS
jgi:hypothetical protein